MPLSDINPGSALTAINSNDAPLLEFRVKRSGTITPLGVIQSIAHEASNDLLKGRLAFSTNSGTATTPQMLIDEQGNVGIGTQDPQARLHLEGNAMLTGPLRIGEDPSGDGVLSVDGNAMVKGKVNATSLHVVANATFEGPLTVRSLNAHGAVEIGGRLSVGEDVVVTGKLAAASFTGDGAGLSNVTPKNESVTNDQLASDFDSLSKVSGGNMVVKDGKVRVGPLAMSDEELDPAAILDVGSRMRVRKGDSGSAGIWFSQGPGDRAFVGMLDDERVGFYGGAGAGWGLRMRIDNGETNIAGKLGIGVSEVGPDSILDVGSRVRVRKGDSGSAGIWFAQEGVEYSAFVGMLDNDSVGFYGAHGLSQRPTGWGLKMYTSRPVDGHAGPILEVNGRLQINQGGYHSAGMIFAQNDVNVRRIFLGYLPWAQHLLGFYNHGVSFSPHIDTKDGTVIVETTLKAHRVLVTGPNKPFVIDHPLDPANKYLYHASVESPDVMNIYNGNVVTDENGSATVRLPHYFEALNRDYRYQLTVIGRLSLAAVEREVNDNTFVIKTDQPHITVSWQVTGIRQDPIAKADPLIVEVDKPEAERGRFLHPELFGYPESSKIGFAGPPEAMSDFFEKHVHSATAY